MLLGPNPYFIASFGVWWQWTCSSTSYCSHSVVGHTYATSWRKRVLVSFRMSRPLTDGVLCWEGLNWQQVQSHFCAMDCLGRGERLKDTLLVMLQGVFQIHRAQCIQVTCPEGPQCLPMYLAGSKTWILLLKVIQQGWKVLANKSN